jgi:amino acid transporter
VCAGAAAYVGRAMGGFFLPTLAGIFVLGSGVVSSATITVAFSHYLQSIVPIPPAFAKLILVSGLSFLSFWGIQESSRFNIVLTLVEIMGLVTVILVGIYLPSPSSPSDWFLKSIDSLDIFAVFSGISIAFYAYIGFEDLSNLAEEAKNPRKDIPRAILFAISVATVLYITVTILLQIHVPQAEIAGSNTPLLLIFEKAHWTWFLKYFSVIATMAILNTGLVNMLMASRLIYGMSNEGLIPKLFGGVHGGRKTPWVGVVITFLMVLLLVFTGNLKTLAQTTSFLIILVFLMVHFSLLKVKWRKDPHHGISFHFLFPVLGLICCFFLLFSFPKEIVFRSLIWFILAAGIWLVNKWNGNRIKLFQ